MSSRQLPWQQAEFWAESAGKLATVLRSGLPYETQSAALATNPWFTPYYLQRALKAIIPWFEPEAVFRFVSSYEALASGAEIPVGIIAAGNVPMVGLHDALAVLFSGNKALIKPSRQDAVLLPWLLDTWARLIPGLERRYLWVNEVAGATAVIATGSNNTARYIEETYGNLPLLLRKNRFSVALPNDDWPPEAFDRLAEDLLLYNGLGCRNVSNLVLEKTFDPEPILVALRRYDQGLLNPAYVRKLAYEKAKSALLGKPVLDAGSMLLTPRPSVDYAMMGQAFLIAVENADAAAGMLQSNRERIQCVVDLPERAGLTQTPRLSEFADQADTFAWLRAVSVERSAC